MQTICELDAARVWTGGVRVIEDDEGAPAGWVFAEAPTPARGAVAQWNGTGWAEIAAPDPMPALREDRATTVMAMRDARIVGGFAFDGVRYQTRDTDRENIAGAAQLAFMAMVAGQGQPGNLRWADADQDFAWIAEDNHLVPMDAPTVVGFGKAAAAFKQRCIFVARALKDAIDKVPDATALDAIDITAGWPV